MIRGQRTLRETLRGEDHQTDVIIRATVDEGGRYIFRCLQTIGLQVLRQHTTGDIHRQHDVDTLRR